MMENGDNFLGMQPLWHGVYCTVCRISVYSEGHWEIEYCY